MAPAVAPLRSKRVDKYWKCPFCHVCTRQQDSGREYSFGGTDGAPRLMPRCVYTLVRGSEPARSHTPTGAGRSADTALPWRGQSSVRTAKTGPLTRHAQTTRACDEREAPGYEREPLPGSPGPVVFDGVPCLFLPAEGSLGKAAACPAFLGGAGNGGPGAALHSIPRLQGQRQSSRRYAVFYSHFHPGVYQSGAGGRGVPQA